MFSPDGGLSVRMSATGPLGDASGVGTRLAEQMLDDGAADLMTAAHPAATMTAASSQAATASNTPRRQHA